MTQSMSRPRRQFLVSLIVAAGATTLSSSPAQAYDENSASAVNIDASGLALKGHDPVAYFSAAKPTPGLARFSAQHQGATYRFASAANRDAYVTNAAKVAPAYGGFCAKGVALEKKLDVDPQAWRVVDGRLVLNVNKDVQKRWLDDVPSVVEKKMFGGTCWMLHGNMLSGGEVGRVMFRVGTEQEAESLSRPGARPMDITGKPMKGFVWVDAREAVGKGLDAGIELAARHVGGLPPK